MADYGWPSGDHVAGMILSSGNNDGAPSGDIIRLVGEIAGGMDDPNIDIQDLPDGYSVGINTGIYKVVAHFRNCIVIDGEFGSSNTTEFNAILSKIRSWHNGSHAPFYIWLYSFTDSDHVKIGYADGAATDYLKGFLDKNGLQWELTGEGGNIYYFKSLTFRGASN